MKRIPIIAAALILAAGLSLRAEEPSAPEKNSTPKTDTLFSACSDSYISGYGSLMWQGSRMGDTWVSLTGARGALIVDNVSIGLSGYGLAYPNHRSSLSGKSYSGTEPYMQLGYGGLFVEYNFMPKRLVNFSMGLTVGGGGYSFTDRRDDDGDDNNSNKRHAKGFFYIEPEVAAHINVTRFCRLGTAVSYRYFRGAGKAEFRNNDFNNIGATVMASFGWF